MSILSRCDDNKLVVVMLKARISMTWPVVFAAILLSFTALPACAEETLHVTFFVQEGGDYRSTLVTTEAPGLDFDRFNEAIQNLRSCLSPLRIRFNLDDPVAVPVVTDYDFYLRNVEQALDKRAGTHHSEYGADRLVTSIFLRRQYETLPTSFPEIERSQIAPEFALYMVADINAFPGAVHLNDPDAIGWYVPYSWWSSHSYQLYDNDRDGAPANAIRYAIVVADDGLGGPDLGAVMAHEMCHALGLDHDESSDQNLMYPALVSGSRWTLTEKQIATARAGINNFLNYGHGSKQSSLEYSRACGLHRARP